jgi:hypothetical protein
VRVCVGAFSPFSPPCTTAPPPSLDVSPCLRPCLRSVVSLSLSLCLSVSLSVFLSLLSLLSLFSPSPSSSLSVSLSLSLSLSLCLCLFLSLTHRPSSSIDCTHLDWIDWIGFIKLGWYYGRPQDAAADPQQPEEGAHAPALRTHRHVQYNVRDVIDVACCAGVACRAVLCTSGGFLPPNRQSYRPEGQRACCASACVLAINGNAHLLCFFCLLEVFHFIPWRGVSHSHSRGPRCALSFCLC